MSRQSASVRIARSAGEVFAYLDDVSREAEWQPNLVLAEQDPPGPSRVGTRKRYVTEFLGRRVENTYEVVEMGPGWRIVYETTPDSAFEVRSEIVCEAEGADTLLTMSIEGKPRGPLRLTPRPVLERAYRKELEAAVGRLRERLEVSA